MKKLIVSAICLLSTSAVAHHSFAMFDNTKDVVLEGTVKEFQWTNPHTWTQVMVNGTEWSIEGGSPNGLKRSGWNKNSMKPGDKVVMTIHPLKDGTSGGSFVKATVNGVPVGTPRE